MFLQLSLVLLLSPALLGDEVNSVYIEGNLEKPVNAKPDWTSLARVHLDGGAIIGFVNSNGSFKIHNIPVGTSWMVEIIHPQFVYRPLRVDINQKGKVRARLYNALKPSEVVSVGYPPLSFKLMGMAQYFQAREQLRTLDMLMNPSIILMLVVSVFIFIMPKFMDDPEIQKLAQMRGNPTNLNEMLSTLSGASQPTLPKTAGKIKNAYDPNQGIPNTYSSASSTKKFAKSRKN